MIKNREGMPSAREDFEVKKRLKELFYQNFGAHGIMIDPNSIKLIFDGTGTYPIYAVPPEQKLLVDMGYTQRQDSPKKVTAKGLKAYLDEYVIKQGDAKIALSSIVRSHYRQSLNPDEAKPDRKKKNALLIGPTGVGKTYLAQTITEELGLPCVLVSAKRYTAPGYVGGDVESIVKDLLDNAKGDISLAEKGIVYLDEIDKIFSSRSAIGGKDVNGSDVQKAILTLIEGTKIKVLSKKERLAKAKNEEVDETEIKDTIDTKNILFIFGGSFSEGSDGRSLAEIIKGRMNKEKVVGIGFGAKLQNKKDLANDYNHLKQVTTQDLVGYGIIPELVGRIAALIALENLETDDLVKILHKKGEDSLVKQAEEEFDNLGIKLKFEDEAIHAIAEKAAKLEIGARGLERVMHETLHKYDFHLENTDIKELTVTKEMVENPEGELQKLLEVIEESQPEQAELNATG